MAWSSLQTGVRPAKHNIFDFLSRNPKNYSIDLSSARVFPPSRFINIGRYKIPLNKGGVRLLRGGKPFWGILGEYSIFSQVIRIPITFPPEAFNGLSLSAMCTPDLLGTQGSFFYFSEDDTEHEFVGGRCFKIERKGDTIEGVIEGPQNPFSRAAEQLKVSFRIELLPDGGNLFIGEEKHRLHLNTFSEWVRVEFSKGVKPFASIKSIALFYIISINPFRLYVSPINIDPEKPALSISHPLYFSTYLSKRDGLFATLGLAEDTWGLEMGILSDKAFIEQAYIFHRERIKMLEGAIEKCDKGLVACVFDLTDRLQHTFFRQSWIKRIQPIQAFQRIYQMM